MNMFDSFASMLCAQYGTTWPPADEPVETEMESILSRAEHLLPRLRELVDHLEAYDGVGQDSKERWVATRMARDAESRLCNIVNDLEILTTHNKEAR